MTDGPVPPTQRPPIQRPLVYLYDGHPPASASSSYESHAYGEEGLVLGALDVARVLRVVRRKWRTVLLVLLFCLATGVFYLTWTDRIYRASSLLELSVRRPRVLAQQEAVIEDQGRDLRAEDIFNTRLERLKGDTMLRSVIQRLKKLDPEGAKSEEALTSLARSVTLSLVRRTRLVRIECENKDARLAARVCNAFAEAAQASVYDESRTGADAAVTWLEGQALTQKKALEAAEATLLGYRQQNNIDALESARKTVESALLDFNKELVATESQEAKAAEILAALTNVDLTASGRAGSLPSDVPRSDEIREAMSRWLAATAERDALRSRFTSKHPEMEARNRVVELYQTQLTEAMSRAKTTAASNMDLYRNQAESLRRKKAEQSKLGSKLELLILERRTHLSALERNRDACDTAYRGVLNRIQEARLAADENTAIIKCVEPARVPEKPVKPRWPVVFGLAVMFGLFGGVALALGTDKLEDRVSGLQDVDAGWGLAILGAIPRVQAGDRRDLVMASLKDPNSQVAEAFAGLRAMLDSAQYRDKSKVILLASSQPEEGKTVTACNLAGSCAGKGQRTLLVDFDLRRPRLAGIFPMPPGQVSLLAHISQTGEDVALDSLVYETEYPRLFVIASKPLRHAAPAHAVGDAKVKALLAWARQKFDRVVIDAPPLGVVSDAVVLGGMADCVLMMIRQDLSRRRLIRHTLERLREAGIGNIAAVLNDVDFSRAGYGSPYYHYSKHYEAYRNPPEAPDSAKAARHGPPKAPGGPNGAGGDRSVTVLDGTIKE